MSNKGMVKNIQKDAAASSMTMSELGNAMSQLNLSEVPLHRHQSAVMDHFMRIMADNIHDRRLAQKITDAQFTKKTGIIV